MSSMVRSVSVSLVLLFVGSNLADAGERYYLLIFGAQSEPPKATDSHSFATFVKATGGGSDPAAWKLELHTISWMPKSMSLEIRLVPEPGKKSGSERFPGLGAAKQGARVPLWTL
ncbi:MAG TPA: hypothetical protein VKS79_25395 [Gemmataceae bacterium]|nr:hypothetical protein [Gemmataceae bacterium]